MRKNRCKCILTVLLAAALGTGCASQNAAVITIEKEPYGKISHLVTEVVKGNLQPEITLKLKMDGTQRIYYDAVSEDLQLDKVYVSIGDKVEKGDILVSFQSDSLQQKIADYQEQCQQKELLVEHYTRLMEIDESLNYSSDIQMLRDDIAVAKLYIEEAEQKLAGYQIVAKEPGTITAIDEYLASGYFVPGKNLITEVCGSGNYSVNIPENYEFVIGDVYTATVGVVSYDMRVADITEQKVVFEPISDMSAVMEADDLIMVIKRPELFDVVYVEAAAVHEGENGCFVYVLDEEGYRNAVGVTTGDKVDNYYVITEGLSGGEKVTLD